MRPLSSPDGADAQASTRGARLRQRAKASGIHLGLSFLVASLAAALVFGIWYPTPYGEIAGGRGLFVLVVSVDLVLGPLVTFAIFDRRKPWRVLSRDLAVVALLQLSGLAYGLHTVWEARPAYLVFEVDRFRVVRAIDIDPDELKLAPPGLQRLPHFGPEIITAVLPTSSDEKMKTFDLAMAGVEISSQPKYWQPYEISKADVLRRSKPLAKLRQFQAAHAADIDRAAADVGLPVERLAYLPLMARAVEWVVLVDDQDARVVGFLPFGGF